MGIIDFITIAWEIIESERELTAKCKDLCHQDLLNAFERLIPHAILIADVREAIIIDSFIEQGIKIERVELRAKRLPESVQASFNTKIDSENKIKKAESELKQAKVDAESKIIRAEAEAKANNIISSSLTPQLIQIKSLETLNPKVQIMYVPSNTSMLVQAPK